MQTDTCSCTQAHADASGQMQVKADERTWTQIDAEQTVFCAWVDEPEDASGHCMFVHKLSGHPIYDNTNVYSMVEGGGILLSVSTFNHKRVPMSCLHALEANNWINNGTTTNGSEVGS